MPCQASRASGRSRVLSLTWVAIIAAGSVDVPPDLMEELLQAADQYMLGSLKRLCEIAIADTLTVRDFTAHPCVTSDASAPLWLCNPAVTLRRMHT